MEVWLQSLVAPKVTVQAGYTSILINIISGSPLVQNLPAADREADGFYTISTEKFIVHRLAIIDGKSRSASNTLNVAPDAHVSSSGDYQCFQGSPVSNGNAQSHARGHAAEPERELFLSHSTYCS